MGYTHNWKHNEISKLTWNRKVMPVAEALIAMAEHEGIHLVYEFNEPDHRPEVSEDKIRFNGGNQEHCETFMLRRHNNSDFQFCKTRGKPYDQVVAAILRFVELIDKKFKLGGDADPCDLRDGEDMLLKCLNEHFPLQYPVAVEKLLALRRAEVSS